MNRLRQPKVSVIIPFYKEKKYVIECVENCLRLDYPSFEVIVVSKVPLEIDPRVKLMVDESDSQGRKKNVGVLAATGDICAFVDDDAYPSPDWLKNAVPHFEEPEIGAVCGPGITPPGDGVLQKASGVILSSFLGAGSLRFRYVPRAQRAVDEAPGYNLLVRRALLVATGGVNESLRSGEDTLLSQKIVDAGKKIVYDPRVVVYHHRRPLLLAHLHQVTNYARHRGYFARRFPNAPFPWVSLLPLAVILALIIGVPLSFVYAVWVQYLEVVATALMAYLAISFVTGLLMGHSIKIAVLSIVGIPSTHLAYAYGLLRGLLTMQIGERPSH